MLKKAQMLNKKVFVAIKNPTNIEKLIAIFDKHNPTLKQKKILIIDDEADYGSVGFRYDRRTDSTIVLTTAQKLSKFRQFYLLVISYRSPQHHTLYIFSQIILS